MKNILLALACFTSLTALGKPLVLTTTQTIASLVKEIAHDAIEVESFTRGTQDPHFVEAKPSYMVKASRADLVVASGLDLEVGWLGNILRGARNPKIQEGGSGFLALGSLLSGGWAPLERPEGKVDRAHGDIHPSGNPHFILDPLRVRAVLPRLTQKLMELVPERKAEFQSSSDAFSQKLADKHTEWMGRIQKSGVKKVVSYHRTLNYFFDRYKIALAGSIEPKPGIPPSAPHIVKLLNTMKAENIKCILVESFFEMDAGERIKKDWPTHLQSVPTEVGSLQSATDYMSLIESLVKAVEVCGTPLS